MSHPDLEYLENLLSRHDWYYHYSDDPKVFAKGRDQAEEIHRQTDICCGLGLSKQAELLRKKYHPNGE